MIRTSTLSALLPALIAVTAGVLHGQTIDSTSTRLSAGPPPMVFSIGQPPIWRQQLSAQATALTQGNRSGATFSYGAFHAFNKPPITALNPLIGLIGGTAEGYGSIGGIGDDGVRVMATSRLLATSVGADWDIRHGRVNTIVSWQSALRRGGLLGRGSMLRVDWIPERGQTVRIGLTAPVFQPLAGRTRPRTTSVNIPDPPRSSPPAPVPRDAVSERLGRDIASASRTIAAYSNLYTNDALHASRTSSYRSAMDRSRTALEQLFGVTLDSTQRVEAARRARAAVLDRIIVPVDSVFGRPKTVNVARLAGGAAADFARWLSDSSGIAPDKRPVAASAFAEWLGAVTAPVRAIIERTHDSRLVWLPMDLALTFDQYDLQGQVDSLIGRVVGHQFSDGNALAYMRSTDLTLEVARSILAARQYHVMWTHEFMGREWTSRAIDNVGYTMVADAYLPALTAAVQRYDSTGVMTMYMILHDQFYYETSDGRLWLTILQDPLNASMHLAGDDGTRERHLLVRQNELRAAVAASRRLQQDARASGNPAQWLRNTVSVHVNVGNQSDFSFRSDHIIPGLPFTPDNLMRDHRKVVIYDVNEADPSNGAVFVMGIGIGDAYSNSSWEDRGFRIRGPAALDARVGLRQTLHENGFSDSEIPAPLRAVASSRAQEEKANLDEFVGRALLVHNDVGFGDKRSSIARAMLYNLAQPGTVMIVPDQLWFSETWAGMLMGAAARGARVEMIAPALANAPIPDAPAMARAHDVLLHMLALRDSLTPTIHESGGELHIGLFAAHAQADDAAGRLREVRAGLARYPWIRQVIPFDDKTLAVLDRVEREVASAGRPDATQIASTITPQPPEPHRKTQIIARSSAIAALLRQPGWDDRLADAMRVQSNQSTNFAQQLGDTHPAIDTAATRRDDEMMRSYETSIPEAERKRVSFYFTEGSHNMDDRGLMSDGETILIVSGPQASEGLVDLFYMMARTTWVDRPAELEQLLPRQSSLISRFARWIRATL